MANMNIRWTLSEQRDEKYTVGQAIEIARMLLNGRAVCVNAVSGPRYVGADTKITLVKLNDLVERMVDDSNYYR